ncbi:hypothetical protein Q5530_05255 [Saccharothrix sp. BKS2]|uniref:hypothetical protein n=1 Tax=Saccharothrix sp. BKS2 TaxID=3064400 RepID=UPI0039EA8297
MSITSASRPASRGWLPVLAWTHVTLGLAGVVAVLASPLFGLVAGALVLSAALAVRSLRRAALTVDRIFEEELDR